MPKARLKTPKHWAKNSIQYHAPDLNNWCFKRKKGTLARLGGTHYHSTREAKESGYLVWSGPQWVPGQPETLSGKRKKIKIRHNHHHPPLHPRQLSYYILVSWFLFPKEKTSLATSGTDIYLRKITNYTLNHCWASSGYPAVLPFLSFPGVLCVCLVLLIFPWPCWLDPPRRMQVFFLASEYVLWSLFLPLF